jgi:membrane associated rhomboid family serine protease
MAGQPYVRRGLVGPVQAPSANVLVVMGLVMAALLALHLAATRGTGDLREPERSRLAVTPATTLSHWWHHLYSGLFHKSWGHIGYNLAVFAAAFVFATRQMGPLQAMANAYWIGPFVVFTLHLLLVLPLAHAGLSYAVKALDYPLVGFSVMAYSVAGAAFVLAPPAWALGFAGSLVVYEVAMAAFGATGPFIFAYHLGGFGLGYWVRTLLLR